ncbi:integration host factor subunit beta [Variovorax boronicumulans]|uniref:integration host factor subunit beta n=1 Tax=Variovorax boronicumulans TaxID=436515 RepID=UPI00358FFD0C
MSPKTEQARRSAWPLCLFFRPRFLCTGFMTRSDLVEELAARFAQLTHRDAEYAVKTILDAMSDALVRGHRIEIRGFGSFSVNRRPPRIGRNPRSGESVQIPEKRVPHFKPGKALREAVDAKTAELDAKEAKGRKA